MTAIPEGDVRWITVTARADDRGIFLTKGQAWGAGELAARRWYELHGKEPWKPLNPKRFGAGTHHIARYPEWFWPEVDRAIDTVRLEGGQGFLWGGED